MECYDISQNKPKLFNELDGVVLVLIFLPLVKKMFFGKKIPEKE